MRYLLTALIFFATVLTSCKNSVKDKKAGMSPGNSKIRNGIVVTSKGINVEQAFLVFDDGSLVPENNVVKINQKVWLRLIISGWQEKDSTVFISGRETVETNKGDVILDNKDLFDSFENGLTPKEAQTLSLSMVITKIDRLYDYFKVSFKIKDEINLRNALEGYYKLHLY
jgi:hypothetical protein